MPYYALRDESLVLAAQRGDPDALDRLAREAMRYAGGIVAKGGWGAPGLDTEDMVMNAMPGFLRAVHDWNPGRGVPFHAFARLALISGLRSCIKVATRLKHQPLNDAFSLDEPIYADNPRSARIERWQFHRQSSGDLSRDPLERVLEAEEDHKVTQAMDGSQLSELERQSAVLFLVHGYTYVEIAAMTGRHRKAIDNALQRAQAKLRRYYIDRPAA